MEQDIFSKFVDLGKEWLEFSRSKNGRESTEYEGDHIKVWCYFADTSNHTAVNFTERESKQVSIGYHSPPKVEFYIGTNLEKIYVASHKLLLDEKEYWSKKSQKEIDTEKTLKIEALQKQLNELKGAA